MIEPKKNIKPLERVVPNCMDRIGQIVRLERNERTIPFSASHLKKILSSINPEEIVAYPNLEPFYEKLSKWLKVDREELLLTSGSDTGIRAVYEVYVKEGDEVLMFPPTYGMYSVYCDMFGGVRREVFYNEDFSLPLDKVLNAINSKTKLVAIANPNHTATVLKEPELIRIIKKARDSQALVFVDEAYFNFYEKTVVPRINEFDNLIVIRTFSKAFGIASLRIGYLVANKNIIKQLYKVKLTHEITGISARFGEYLLDHLDIMESYVQDVRAGIKYLSKEFEKLGIATPKTHTNFLFAKLPLGVDGKQIVSLLKERRFCIAGPFSITPIEGFIRVTVGPVKQMRGFISAFKLVYEQARKGRLNGEHA
ncbi:MAG: histidinol-phosphate transaminase [Candidatus Omnitrophota bacterium]|nr:histidinol-phosphate transaminase [Candidatus Omnitrophota bacterium]